MSEFDDPGWDYPPNTMQYQHLRDRLRAALNEVEEAQSELVYTITYGNRNDRAYRECLAMVQRIKDRLEGRGV